MSAYKKILDHIQNNCVVNGTPKYTFTPKDMIYKLSLNQSELADYLNSFNTLMNNDLIKMVSPNDVYFNDSSIEYYYTPVPPTAVEQTNNEVGELLTSFSKVVNDLNLLYPKIEKLRVPVSVDLSKISKDDLIAELMKRMK